MHDFLTTGVRETPAWKQVTDAELDTFIAALQAVYAHVSGKSQLNEAATEDEIIIKVLAALGWTDLLRNQSASKVRRQDVPDILLFPDAPAKTAALKEKRDDRRYRHGIAIAESKRWQRALDRGDATDKFDPGTPSNQILRYLTAVENASDRRIRWGILTNGRQWRLYWQGARSRSEEFLEVDVGALVGVRGLTADLEDGLGARQVLKIFLCTFRKAGFLPQSWDDERRTFHEYALAEARHYEEKVSQNLGERVFRLVFPDLANALAAYDPQAPKPYVRSYLDAVREAALILLYRLLFVLYAEDRLLLPVGDARYRDYSLRRLRDEVRDKRDAGASFSKTATRIWDALKGLFASIASGDTAIGLPAYNGGLFENHHSAILNRARIPDERMAIILDELSRRVEDVSRYWINYRDLSVQHLGSIYERLLEFRLEHENGILVARPTSFARKTTGSFYTHEDLVSLIIEETIDPLVNEKRRAFAEQLDAWSKRRQITPAARSHLSALDPASEILGLRVCDPAMGSGHFLVSLVDYLADVILETMDDAAEQVLRQPWAKRLQNPWRSPLVDRIADIRERILAAAREHRWNVDAAQLDDRHIVRRMILKRVIHGVDKNPMAVELAKVALWLHTFTVGAPLSFLDHHLRWGDSLHGEHPARVQDDLVRLGVMFQQGELFRIENATRAMAEIAQLTDIDVAEAHRSMELLADSERELAPLNGLLSFWRALRWLVPKWPHRRFDKDDPVHKGIAELFSGRHDLMRTLMLGQVEDHAYTKADLLGDQVTVPHDEHDPNIAAANAVIDQAQAVTMRERFLHWSLAFPHVWPVGGRAGFDAVIGNPPWDRIKLQEVEWFAERRTDIAKSARAADRKTMIDALARKHDPLHRDYVEAADAAETAARVARECGDYPLLSGGDINLYSLFVERAASLIHPRGLVGLLTPSGIAADKSAAAFFGSVSSSGRLATLFDFENRYNPGGSYFPDVDSRFKFSVFVFGGEAREHQSSRCTFYLHDVGGLKSRDRVLELTASDFEAVNPNTGGAPIFRTKRDAEITTAIYRRQPVLIDRRPQKRGHKPKKVWPVRYVTMFHMTNDSKLFKRRDELERAGWYPVEGNRYKKRDAIALPLYEGKMVQMYDHRAANVVVHSDNVHRPAQQEATSLAHHQDPNFSPQPQFWVEKSAVDKVYSGDWALGFKEITAPTNERSMIASIVPGAAFGNKLPLWIPENVNDKSSYAFFAPLFVANLNAFAFDFVVRQKLQGQTLNLFIVEQLPMIKPEQFEAKIRKRKIANLVREEVLRLSYTANDLEPFARDLGYSGKPFKWDEDDRRHRMARLDALFFHLYGISREDAAYILDTFPIVREQDEKALGRYLTKDLILAYMNAVAAGDLTSVVKIG